MRLRSALFGGLAFIFLNGCAGYPRGKALTRPNVAQATACVAGPFNAAVVEHQAGPATVLVVTANGSGSGFVINDGREQLVVTNFHVVASGTQHFASLRMTDGGQRQTGLEVVQVDRDRDLALLRPVANLAATPLTLKAQPPSIGEGVAVVGYPGVAGSDLVLTFEPGTVTATERHIAALDFIQTNANINPGNSGGPLVDSCGQVVGVVAALHATTRRLGLVIPVSAVNELLNEYHKPQLAPQAAAEAQLQRFFTELKFRRSDKAAQYFTRGFIEKKMSAELVRLSQQATTRVTELKASLRKKGRDLLKLSPADAQKELTAHLSPAEIRALNLTNGIEAKQLNTYDASALLLADSAADILGPVDDIWLDSSNTTKEGCVEAYVSVTSGAQTRRYVVHLHHQIGQWLIEFINQAR